MFDWVLKYGSAIHKMFYSKLSLKSTRQGQDDVSRRYCLVVPVFRNVGKRSTAKNYRPASLLSVISKVFEKLVNIRIVDHLEKCCLFSDFQYGFRSS